MDTQHLKCGCRRLGMAAVMMWVATGQLFPVSFNAPRAYSLGGSSGNCLALGDFNGDGTPDAAVATFSSPFGTVQILLGNGDTSFTTKGGYLVPSPAFTAQASSCLVSGDFNRDGNMDLAMATQEVVSVLLGNGDGTFRAPVNYPMASGPFSITTADFNGDGIPDLATANPASNNVSILLGHGDGTFAAPVSYGAGNTCEFLAAGDFNGDGKPDLAVTNNNPSGAGTISILFGTGDGTFRAAVNHAVGKLPLNIAVADFNRDGKPDLAVIDVNGLVILLAAGGGAFRPPVTVAAGVNPGGVVAVDFNKDGNPDFAVANLRNDTYNTGGYTVSIIKGNGDGTFQPPASYYVAQNPLAVAFGDFNGDGRLDLAAACASGVLSILPNNGKGGLQQIVNQSAGTEPASLVVGDFNGDGKPDLAVANQGSSNVSILLGLGGGKFAPQVTYNTAASPFSIVAGDFNKDGKTDLAVACSGNYLSILLGKGDGTFQAAVTSNVPTGIGSLGVGDFNGDGKSDLATVVYPAYDVTILLSQGDGTFSPQILNLEESFASALGVSDLNGDGKPDLAIQDESCADEFCFAFTDIYLGNGDGTFNLVYSTYAGYNPPIAGDFNGDGKQDLVGGGLDDAWVTLGNGDGTFGTSVGYPAGYAVSLAIGDFNRDGKLDVVSNGGGIVAILPGQGDGTFQDQIQFIVGGCPAAVVVADFNGDGKPDIATANSCSNNVTIMTNTTR